MKRLIRSFLVAVFALFVAACATPNGQDADAKGAAGASQGGGASAGKPGVGPATAGTASRSADRPSGDSPSAQGTPAPGAPTVDPQVKAEQLLNEGTELYERGDYKGAIRKLTLARDGAASGSRTKLGSLKYLAFSYCVTGQKAFCKAQFAALLKASPEFQLSRGEASHPLWGPVFKEARAESGASAAAGAKPKK